MSLERMDVRGYVARVRFIEEDEAAVHVELENSKRMIVTLEDCDLWDVEVGSVVFLRDNYIEPAPEELWSEETWVGVVRLNQRPGSLDEVVRGERGDAPQDTRSR